MHFVFLCEILNTEVNIRSSGPIWWMLIRYTFDRSITNQNPLKQMQQQKSKMMLLKFSCFYLFQFYLFV